MSDLLWVWPRNQVFKNTCPLELAQEDRWSPWPQDIDAFIDPMKIIQQTIIPVLALFGELDKNIDPVQGAQACETALQTAGNQHNQVVVIPRAEHVFVSAPEYLETMEAWIQRLSQ